MCPDCGRAPKAAGAQTDGSTVVKPGGGEVKRLAGVAAGKEVVHSRAHCLFPGWKEQGC